jgi:translation initiation factor 2B subunit (eIF-2B alpha/beta/delta family)
MAAGWHRKSSRERSGLLASSGMRIAKSHALMFQSKLLLLNSANHSYRRTRTRKDLKRVEHFRSELHRAEANLRSAGPGEFSPENGGFWLQIYAKLIDRATASLDRMKSAMSSREAADRFETATDVQMLEELIVHWTSRIELIRKSTGDGRHQKV